jgi:HEAT repeat protein
MKQLALSLLLVAAAGAGELTVAQRNDACYALRGQRSTELVAEMRRAIDDPVVRSCAARNLREAGAAEALIDALESGTPDTRVAAAHELGAMRDGRALAALGRASLDPNALVASSAIVALGDYEDRAALPYLLKAAEAQTVAGMTALVQAARLHDAAVLPRARAALAKGDVAAQVVALGIIADLGDAGDLPALREMQKHSEPVSVRGRGFGFMPAIDLARAARTAIERIGERK